MIITSQSIWWLFLFQIIHLIICWYTQRSHDFISLAPRGALLSISTHAVFLGTSLGPRPLAVVEMYFQMNLHPMLTPTDLVSLKVIYLYVFIPLGFVVKVKKRFLMSHTHDPPSHAILGSTHPGLQPTMQWAASWFTYIRTACMWCGCRLFIYDRSLWPIDSP